LWNKNLFFHYKYEKNYISALHLTKSWK
jgi:hypothetical protein